VERKRVRIAFFSPRTARLKFQGHPPGLIEILRKRGRELKEEGPVMVYPEPKALIFKPIERMSKRGNMVERD